MGYRVDSFDLNGALLEAEEQDDGSYLGRHWRGHLSLAQSYWLNGFLTNLVIAGLGLGLFALEQTGRSLRLIALGFLVYVTLIFVVRIWATVGIWRSAGRHAARGGTPAWGFTARAVVAIGVLVTLAQVPALGLQAKEYGLIAIGRDPIGPAPTIITDSAGETLQLQGVLSAGAADHFEAMVDAAPAARLVVLDSDGGRIFEALRMAKLIRARGLDTRVEQHCASACTLLLLAGKERSAHRFAQIGFHQPDFPGLSEADRITTIERNRGDYIRAGIEASFLDRALSTPPSEMWYPTHAELVRARVLTGEEVAVGSPQLELNRLGEMLARMHKEVNAGRGTMLDEITRLNGARLAGKEFRMQFGVTRPFSRAEAENLQAYITAEMQSEVCDSPKREMVKMGAAFGFDYFDPAGSQIASFTVNRCAEPSG